MCLCGACPQMPFPCREFHAIHSNSGFERNESCQGRQAHRGSPRPSVAFGAFRLGGHLSVSVCRHRFFFWEQTSGGE